MTLRYLFRDLSFDVPDGLVDQSMVVLVDEDSLALTVAREERAFASGASSGVANLKAYVDEAIKELQGSVTGYTLEKREDRTVNGKNAIVLVQTAMTPEGQPVAQRQAYLDLAGDVVVVTATAPKKDASKATAAFDKMLASLKVG